MGWKVDRQQISIRTPDGSLLADNGMILKKSKLNWLRYICRKRLRGGLPRGLRRCLLHRTRWHPGKQPGTIAGKSHWEKLESLSIKA